MKKLFVLTILILGSFSASAQERTLFSNSIDHGGFGGPAVKFTSIKGEFGVMVGGYGGWLIDHTLMLGAGGYGLATDIRAARSAELLYDVPAARPLYLDLGYGGGIVEVILRSDDLVHAYANVLVGAGYASYRRSWREIRLHDQPRADDDDDQYHFGGYDAFFVLEPSVNAELNMTSWMRLGAGVSYRYVSGIGMLDGITNADLKGFSGQMTLKFGAF